MSNQWQSGHHNTKQSEKHARLNARIFSASIEVNTKKPKEKPNENDYNKYKLHFNSLSFYNYYSREQMESQVKIK